MSRCLRAATSSLAGLIVLAGFAPGAQAETVLITGANSGIGLEFTKQYAAKGWSVIATHRRDETPETLQAVIDEYPNVRAERMNVTSHDEIKALAAKLEGVPIDVLINNAGVFALGGAWVGGGEDGADYAGQMFGTFDYEQFDVFVETNIRGPMMVSEAFIEHVKASEQKKIIAISSENGRITGEPLCCGLFWYRMSKAALNKLLVQLSAVLKDDGVIVVPLNPGAVRVEKQAELEFPGMLATDFSVGHMIETIGKLTLADSGRFVNYDGTTAPW